MIIDANVAHEFAPPTPDAAAVLDWLRKRGGMVAAGGRLKRELQAVRTFRALYQALVLAGRLYQYDDGAVDAAEDAARTDANIVSNDAHIIGLARVSGSRLLFSRDRDLHRDFRNPKILAPRGHIYQERDHRRLLGRAPQCRPP